MNAIALAVACTMGIDVGWQPVEDGPGVEYILQLDAESLEVLQGGEMFVSDIPAQVRDIRRLQISFGTRKLPRKLPKLISPPPPVAKTPGEPGRFTPEEGSQPIVPPAESGTQLVAGAEPAPSKAKKGEPSKLLATESVSSLDALMNTKGTGKSDEGTSAKEPLPLVDGSAEPRPWIPLVGAVLGLFGSLGANVFLGWLWFGERTRYRKALARMAPREA